MRGFNDKYFEELTRVIEEVEARTTAEIVVVVHPWSGNYRDVDMRVGAGVALLTLAGLFYSPWIHSEFLSLVDVTLSFVLGTWVASALPAVRRALTRATRRAAQVRMEAAAAFYEEGVWTTRGRTGLVIYVSLLERTVDVLADQGITQNVPAPAWNACLADLHRLGDEREPAQGLLRELRELGDVLAAAMPPLADNPDELPNRPRARK